MYCFICGRRRVAVARYRIICLVLLNKDPFAYSYKLFQVVSCILHRFFVIIIIEISYIGLSMSLLVFYDTRIIQLYMWRHRFAGGLKKLYLRSGSQRHWHFVGFFNVPVLHRHGITLFIRLFRETAKLSRLLRHAGDTEDVFSTQIPRRLHGGS